MNEEPSFGTIVKERRNALGLTQTELARRVGCAPVTIRKIEYDALRPSVQIAEHLAVALNIPEAEQLAFVRLARHEREVSPIPTPPPALEEIGQEDLTGRAIKGFQLGERIGAGGYGVVYRATQATVEREVAIKIILPRYADQPDFIRRFEAEAQLVARLEHPHIVPLYDYWREPGVAYLVMRFLRGGSLADMLQSGPPAHPTIMRVLEQICAGLHAAHRAGVIHRDIKPANILLDEDGNAYLADFGIAKNLSEANGGLTSGQIVIGSPAYISPEQILAEPVKPQTDIYSLGVMLYELLTGHKPFKGPTPVAYIQQHLNEQLPLLAAAFQTSDQTSKVFAERTFEVSTGQAIPTSLDIVIGRATAKEPRERYPDILSMLADIRRAMQPESTIADISDSQAAMATPAHLAAMIDLPDLQNPYKGLRAFGEADAADFFGRDTLVQALLIRMAEESDVSRFLVVVGPSGSGKSSVARAGLIPALRQGGLPGSEQWFIIEMIPGAHPLEELEAALLRVAVNPPDSLLAQLREDERGLLRAVKRVLPADGQTELALVIDQFEELFTLVTDEEVRAHFLASLVTAVLDPGSRLRVVITLRADFTGHPLQYLDFGELVRQRTEFVLPLTPDELEQAITGPTKRAGLSLEPGLTPAIIREIGDQPGMLPLLQYALTELFERRQGRLLTLKAYRDSGGVLGALARRAEELYADLDEAGQEAARQLFLRLVTLGEGTEDTRRRVLRSELSSLVTGHLSLVGETPANHKEQVTNDKGQMTIDQFGRYRLLTFDRDPISREPTVEVAHEALLREWGRLREWLNESREDIRQERVVARAAEEWDRYLRDVSFLLRGVRLEQIEKWQETTTLMQTPLEQEFIAQSLQQRAQEQQAEMARKEHEAWLEQRSRTFLRGLVAVFAVAAIISAGLGLFAFQQRQVALDNAAEAQNVALIAGSQAALANNDTDAALALAWQAVSLNPDSAVAQAQLSEVAYTPGTVRRFVGHTDMVNRLAINPDGRTVLSGSVDNTLILWDLETGAILWQREGHTTPTNDVAFSPDGQIAASVSDEMAILWDVQTGRIIRQFDGHEEAISKIAFSPDGQSMVTAGWGDDSILIHWDVESGEIMQRFESNSNVEDIEFTPDGSAILYGRLDDGTLRLIDIQSGQIIHEMKADIDIDSGALRKIAISPDGLTAISGFENSEMFLWDLSTGALIRRYPVDGGAHAVAFHPDNGTVLVGGVTGILITLDLETGEILNTFTGHTEIVLDVAITPNGRYAVSASRDKTLRLWELNRGHVIRQFAAPSELAFEVDLSPDGRTALSASLDGTVTLWDVETGEMIRRFTDDQPVMAVTYSPDGKTALIGTGYRFAQKLEPGHVILWDVETGEEIRRFVGQPYVVFDVEFSPDGKPAVSSGNGAIAILWDVETGQEIRRFDDYFVDSPWPGESFWDVEFSPDGSTILASYSYGPIILWDVETGEEIGQLVGHVDSGATGITVSADGQRVVSGGWDTQAILWDMQTGSIIRRFTNHVGPVGQVQFTPDERLMLGGSGDGTNSLWDVETGEVVRRYGNGFVIMPVFNADGSQALVGLHDGAVELWRMDTTLDELLEWTQTNRYIPELTCEQRALYKLEPLCAEEDSKATPASP
jgi:WD40 repeat protein/serine/threonine protein kinase/DNA-binding XRE family transcriptional regulator